MSQGFNGFEALVGCLRKPIGFISGLILQRCDRDFPAVYFQGIDGVHRLVFLWVILVIQIPYITHPSLRKEE
jgi:uncharacterized membrane protein